MRTRYQLQLNMIDPSGGPEKLVWDTGKLTGNRSVFTATQPVVSATAYHWRVRAWIAGSDNATAWTDALFSTALLQQSDWDGSEWISPPDTTQMASQMRKEFTLPAGDVLSARAFVALPGYGAVSVNGQRIDDEAGVLLAANTISCTTMCRLVHVTRGLDWVLRSITTSSNHCHHHCHRYFHDRNGLHGPDNRSSSLPQTPFL